MPETKWSRPKVGKLSDPNLECHLSKVLPCKSGITDCCLGEGVVSERWWHVQGAGSRMALMSALLRVRRRLLAMLQSCSCCKPLERLIACSASIIAR